MTSKVVLELDFSSNGTVELSNHQVETLKKFTKSLKFVGINEKYCDLEIVLYNYTDFNEFIEEMNRYE